MNRLTKPCLALVVLLAGCAGGGTGGGEDTEFGFATRGLRESDRRVESDDGRAGRVALYVNGNGVAWDDVHARMAERAGGAVLREVVLETLLEERCRATGIAITEGDLARERGLLLGTLRDDGVDLDRGSEETLLAELLRRRNLGERGFRALLRRTAMSRALVAGDVALSESAIDRAHDLRYGTRYEARLIVTPTPALGAEAARRVRAGEDFEDVARELSTDPSSATGGRIPDVHPADLSWPAAVRRAVAETPEGGLTSLVAVENGYALLRVVRAMTPDASGLSEADRRAVAERDARLEAERLLMARLANDLLGSADV
ncbi:MAG: peptidylprolyl isomerase, partial [Planctomycetota bacterium]